MNIKSKKNTQTRLGENRKWLLGAGGLRRNREGKEILFFTVSFQ